MAIDIDIDDFSTLVGEATSSTIWELSDFTGLVDHATGAVGRVVSSEKEPAGSHTFHFWGADEALTLDIGHIVVAFSEEAAVIGVVDEPRRYSDMRSFLDDYFDRRMEIALPENGPTSRPEILVFQVNVLATKHLRPDVQSNRPAVNGPVFFATNDAIGYALGVAGFDGHKIPALMHTNGNYTRDKSPSIWKVARSSSKPHFTWMRTTCSAPRPVTPTGLVNPAWPPKPAMRSF
jgi:hypothetical protein